MTNQYDEIKARIKKRLLDERPKAIILRGSWGIGKTHVINELFEEPCLKKKKPIYISLFGLNRLEELNEALTVKSIGGSHHGKVNYAKEIMNKFKGFLDVADVVINVTSSLFTKFALEKLKERVICIDDWERSKLNATDLMGFIDDLKTQKKCHVILIFNDQQIADEADESCRKYEEKVFDHNVKMDILPDDAFEIIAKNSNLGDDVKNFAEKRLKKLGLSNIRVIEKILLNAVELIEELDIADNFKATEKLLSSLILFSWAHYLPEDKSPDIEYLETYNFYVETSFRIEGETNKDTGEVNKRYENASLLSDYGYHAKNEIDEYIIQILKSGYLNSQNRVLLKMALNRIISREETDNKLQEIRRLYSSGFGNDDDKLFKMLTSYKDAFLAHFANGHYSNDDAKTNAAHIIGYYRILEKNPECTQFINAFLSSIEKTDFFDYRDIDPIWVENRRQDQEYIEAIKATIPQRNVKLEHAIRDVSFGQNVTPFYLDMFNEASDEAIEEACKLCELHVLRDFLFIISSDVELRIRIIRIIKRIPEDTPLNKHRLNDIRR